MHCFRTNVTGFCFENRQYFALTQAINHNDIDQVLTDTNIPIDLYIGPLTQFYKSAQISMSGSRPNLVEMSKQKGRFREKKKTNKNQEHTCCVILVRRSRSHNHVHIGTEKKKKELSLVQGKKWSLSKKSRLLSRTARLPEDQKKKFFFWFFFVPRKCNIITTDQFSRTDTNTDHCCL